MDQSVLDFIRELPIFDDFSAEDLEVVVNAGVKRTLPKGSYLFREGDPAEAMYLQMSGRTRIFASDQQGKEFVFAIGETGEIYGQISMIDDAPRTASVEVEEESNFVMFSKADFRTALEAYPQLKDKLILNMARIIRGLSHGVKALALLDVYGRVRELFERLIVTQDDGIVLIPEPLTQQAIADRVGSSREMIARILKELVFGGYIKLENRKIILLQPLPERF
ncbi:Crp/Fnr family transcriptional regulator [Chitinibacteraceae bacterium HSL-7]